MPTPQKLPNRILSSVATALFTVLVAVQVSAQDRTEVLIIGGGVAGLATVDELDRKGVSDILLIEEAGRVGGRMWTERNTGSSAYYERGAELVNTSDRALRSLLNRYGIGLTERRFVRENREESFLFNERIREGNTYRKGEVIPVTMEKLLEWMNEIPADKAVLNKIVQLQSQRESTDAKVKQDTMHFLRSVTASELVKGGDVSEALFNALMSSEFGTPFNKLTGEVLLDYVTVTKNASTGAFHIDLIPAADERFRITGGTDSIIGKLEKRFGKKIRSGTSAMTIHENAPDSFTVTVKDAEGKIRTIDAKHVVFAAPAHALNNIKIESPSIKQADIEEAKRLPFGSNAKIFLRFSEKFWDKGAFPFTGVGVLESGVQFWDTSEDQVKRKGGVITIYPGDWPLDEKAHEQRLKQVLAGVRKHPAFADMDRYLVEVDRQVWKQSYAGSFTPEYPRAPKLFAEQPTSNIYFVGSDKDINREREISASMGYMDGAVRTAKKISHRLIKRLQPAAGGMCIDIFAKVG